MRSMRLAVTIVCLTASGALAMGLPAELIEVPGSGLPPSLSYSPQEDDWLALRARTMSEGATYGEKDNQAPIIMLGGYFDTLVTEADGGQLNFIVYVTDPDGYSDITRVELFYAGTGTGVLLRDDGNHGDFSAGDSVFGFTAQIGADELPAGYYTLEVQAVDQAGNRSDLWPYLTVHP